MREKNIRSRESMSEAASAFVDDAADFANALTLADMVRAGDYGNAMRRVARQVGVSHSVLKHLRYDKPKEIGTADFSRLGAAYGRQRKTGRATVEVTPRTVIGRILVGVAASLDSAADTLDREDIGTLND